VDADAIGRAMAAQAGVAEVHDLHVWEVTSGFPAMSAHVLVGERNACHEISYVLKRLLHAELEIDHTTLQQVDHEQTQLLTIETEEQRRRATRSNQMLPGELETRRDDPRRSRGPGDADGPFRQPWSETELRVEARPTWSAPAMTAGISSPSKVSSARVRRVPADPGLARQGSGSRDLDHER
jgi:hypothetical protein